MESEYLETLMLNSRDVGERYRMKLRMINDLDPFTLDESELDYSIDSVPPITYNDISAYLVFTHSYYSHVQMKAYKSLESYKYFESGFVLKVGVKIVNNLHILVGQVKHSQRANVKPLDVWCIIARDGSICSAHCTSMAGNSEVCSHVGATLFAADYANTKREAMSCTDLRSVWPMPSMMQRVPIVPVHEVNWGKMSGNQVNEDIDVEVPPMSDEGLNNMLQSISDLGYSCPIMRIVEPFASQISDSRVAVLTSVLNIFNPSYMNSSYSELMTISKLIDISVSKEQIIDIEEAIRKQAETDNWYLQRAGRITASKFRAVCRTNKNNPLPRQHRIFYEYSDNIPIYLF